MEAVEGHAIRSETVSGDLDAAVRQALVLAREAAQEEDAAVVIGWWLEGESAQFMIVPEDHELTERFAFTPIMRVFPDGMFLPLLRQREELV